MAKQVVNLGSSANAGDGDTLRAGGDKINDNFDELYAGIVAAITTAAAARTALGLVIGTDVQAYDADLAAIAALSTTAYGRALLALADAAAARTAIGTPDATLVATLVGAETLTNKALTLPTLSTSTPASAGAAGVAGTITWDASYIYICTATNTWKRVAIATW